MQIDYRLPDTRRAMSDLLLSIADRCDGVRCDMAMLLTRDVFLNTWGADWLDMIFIANALLAFAMGIAYTFFADRITNEQLLFALIGLIAAIPVRGSATVLWTYPAILLFHFVLERRVANAIPTRLYNICCNLFPSP